jgi:uncharacterized protein (TIGR03032 family)
VNGQNSVREAHDRAWRNPEDAIAAWSDSAQVDARLLTWKTRGRWWDVLEETDTTLLVSREYEHLLLAMRVENGRPHVSFMQMPHPSGLAVDLDRGVVYVASTRNPNQVYTLSPAVGLLPRSDLSDSILEDRPLVPVASRIVPGSTYLHDLAVIGGVLHGSAVGMNAIVRLDGVGSLESVWWPRCIERDGIPDFGRNHLQLNGIAGGTSLECSFFTASADRITARKPGHRNWPVDRRGVIFSGLTREPVAHGLTRPHSPRFIDGEIWVDDSGYGTVGVLRDHRVDVLTSLPGWTRGLSDVGRYAFAATSRVIPRFRQYAPGLDVERSECGLHAIDRQTGECTGSLLWPAGDQIFAIARLPAAWTTGLPFTVANSSGRSRKRSRTLFYAFRTGIDPVWSNEGRDHS